ncbi:hypothetical protein C0J52_11896, partial [Blattella germanica]
TSCNTDLTTVPVAVINESCDLIDKPFSRRLLAEEEKNVMVSLDEIARQIKCQIIIIIIIIIII